MSNNTLSKIITVLVFIIIIISIILLFNGSGDTANLKLKGLSDIVINQNEIFIDPGYEIVDAKNKTGFYVNIDGVVDNNKAGVYYLKYLLYNKKGELISEATRRVFVIDNSNIVLYLNGEEEEFYFVNDYIDNGAVAYQNNKDISDTILVDSNVNSMEVGTYEVRYQVIINDKIEEVIRKVNIIDFNIDEDVVYPDLVINLAIGCDNYYYTVLPDDSKVYSKDIYFPFSEVGTYDFEVYLKSGSHKKYSVNIITVDKEGPTGTCTLNYDNNKTVMTMNVTDKSGVAKYSYNGLEFYNNTNTVNSIVSNVTVRAYDKYNNYTDIKCKAEYGTGFRNINVKKNGYITCGTSTTNASKELDTLMRSYGYKTRSAVAAAGVYLASYQYNIPYFWGGKSIAKGIDPTWGCRKKHTTEHNCSKSLTADHSYCEYGLDCAGFTRWAFIQAGFDNSILRGDGQTEHLWGQFNPKKHLYKFQPSNMAYINQIKPGDIVHKPGHVGLVIGVDTDTIQVAEMTGPINIDIIKKSNGVSINRQSNFTDFVLFDEFYKMYGNS